MNEFRSHAEYIPFFFSLTAPVILVAGLALRGRWIAVWKDLGYFVGWAAVLIGITGVVLHLDSSFFWERTLRSLTYSAPFAAPLAYTGLGLLLLLNRMIDVDTEEWAQWVLLLACGGFVGNFVLSLTDHASNGFFQWEEWIPVIASALAVGFLVTPLLVQVSRGYLLLCAGLLILEGGVGIWDLFCMPWETCAAHPCTPFRTLSTARRL